MAHDKKTVKQDVLLDHDADGIREYDNRLPRWWLYGFYVTIILGIVYIYYYHIYTGPDWNILWYGTRGQEKEYAVEVAEARVMMANAPKTEFKATKALTDQAALKKGDDIFHGSNLCYTCHRADLGGVIGPNLTDDYWLHGGKLQDILNSIRHGYPDKGMLPYGNNNHLTDEELLDVASYVISMHDTHPPDAKPVDAERDKKEEND